MDSQAALEMARRTATRALNFDPGNAAALDALSTVQFIEFKNQTTLSTARTSVRLNPGLAMARASLAHAMAINGHGEDALAEADRAMALDPSPDTYVSSRLAIVYFLGDRFETAARLSAEITRKAPNWYDGHVGVIVANGEMGRLEEAKKSVEAIKTKHWPALNWRLSSIFSSHWHPDALAKWLSAMAKGGVPEWPYGFRDDPAKRLGEDEIRALVVGKRMRGQAIYNMDFDQDIHADGRMAYSNAWAKTRGRWTLEGDRFHARSDYVFSNQEYFGYFYHNETPTQDNPHPYIHINMWDRYYFSITEIQRGDGT